MAAALSEEQIKAINALELKDSEDEPVAVVSVEALDPGRHAIYAAALPDFPAVVDATKSVASVHCKDGEDETMEHIVVVSVAAPVTAEPITFEDKIMYDEVPLSGIVEYRFSAERPFMLGSISLETLEFYRSSKFTVWKDLLTSGGGGCKRAFKSMLKTGLVINLYDPLTFPSPEDEKKDWEVEDSNTGKMVAIPRPVSELRVWDAGEKKYEAVSSRMDGAPAEADAPAYWAKMLTELKKLHGADQVDELLV